MTTIAFDTHGNVAWDSQITQRGVREQTAYEKVSVVKGVLFAGAGDAGAITNFIKWYLSKAKKKNDRPDGDWEVVVIDKGKMHYFTSGSEGAVVVSAPQTLGSGGQIARTALLLGKNAKEAVEIACDMDVFSGPPVRAFKVATLIRNSKKPVVKK